MELTDSVMKKVTAGDLKGAFAQIKPYTAVPSAEFDAMGEQAQLQMPAMGMRFGKPLSYEIVRTDTAGGSLAKVMYIQRYEKHAAVWNFILYRGAEGWTINTFWFVDDVRTAF